MRRSELRKGQAIACNLNEKHIERGNLSPASLLAMRIFRGQRLTNQADFRMRMSVLRC